MREIVWKNQPMTKTEVEQQLAVLGKNRRWLAERTGYTYDTLRNALAPKAKDLSFAMGAKIESVFRQEHECLNNAEPAGNVGGVIVIFLPQHHET